MLASKLEDCGASKTAAAAQAAPQISARLVDVLERLRERVPGEVDVIDRLRRRRQARLLAIAARIGGR